MKPVSAPLPLALLPMLALAGVVAAPFSAQAGDWPQWRGPNREAVSTEKGLLQEWPADGPKLVWSLRGLGKGFSTVAIAGGKLFTLGNADGQCLMAYDLSDQKRLWKTKIGPANDDPHSTPTVDGDRVYAFGTAADLACVDAADGKEIWHKSLTKEFGARSSGWNFSESPLVDGDKLICTPGGDQVLMVALNKKTGEVIWKCALSETQKAGKAGHASIVVSEGAGVRQYVTLTSRGAVSVSAADGKLLWVYPRVANGTANIPTPVVQGDFVFVSTAYGAGAALLKLAKTPEGVKAEEVYFLKADTFQCHHGGFLRVGDYIYGAHGHNQGNPICLEMATGKVAWRAQQPGGGSGAVLYADGRLYYRWEDDTVALVEANPSQYVQKGRFKLPKQPGMDGPGWAHPVILDGRLYLRHADVLFCYDVKGS
jgi:outer membrane protein assembly factor BamB